MRTYHIFNINKSIAVLTKDDSYPLYYSFSKIKNFSVNDLSMGINLFEQIALPIDKLKFNKKIYNHYKESDFYTKFKDNHTYINKYRGENTNLYLKNIFLKLESNKDYPEFFKCLKNENNLFVCDFDNKDYFYLNEL